MDAMRSIIANIMPRARRIRGKRRVCKLIRGLRLCVLECQPESERERECVCQCLESKS